MAVTIELSGQLSTCPQYWQNFVNATNPDNLNGEEEIDRVLASNYNALFVTATHHDVETHEVVFNSQEDYIQFLLTWGDYVKNS